MVLLDRKTISWAHASAMGTDAGEPLLTDTSGSTVTMRKCCFKQTGLCCWVRQSATSASLRGRRTRGKESCHLDDPKALPACYIYPRRTRARNGSRSVNQGQAEAVRTRLVKLCESSSKVESPLQTRRTRLRWAHLAPSCRRLRQWRFGRSRCQRPSCRTSPGNCDTTLLRVLLNALLNLDVV